MTVEKLTNKLRGGYIPTRGGSVVFSDRGGANGGSKKKRTRRGGSGCNGSLQPAPVKSVAKGGSKKRRKSKGKKSKRGGNSVLPAWALLGTNLLVGPKSHKKRHHRKRGKHGKSKRR